MNARMAVWWKAIRLVGWLEGCMAGVMAGSKTERLDVLMDGWLN